LSKLKRIPKFQKKNKNRQTNCQTCDSVENDDFKKKAKIEINITRPNLNGLNVLNKERPHYFYLLFELEISAKVFLKDFVHKNPLTTQFILNDPIFDT